MSIDKWLLFSVIILVRIIDFQRSSSGKKTINSERAEDERNQNIMLEC